MIQLRHYRPDHVVGELSYSMGWLPHMLCAVWLWLQDPNVHPWAIMKPFFIKVGHLLQLTNATKNIEVALAEFRG
jgi:hypothetical protein